MCGRPATFDPDDAIFECIPCGYAEHPENGFSPDETTKAKQFDPFEEVKGG